MSKVKVIKEEELKMNASLALEQIALRLSTVSRLGDTISQLKPKLMARVNIMPDINQMSVSKHDHFNTHIIDIPLDSTPDLIWQEIFEQEWKASRDLWDRKLAIVGDKLRLITMLDDIDAKINWLKQVIEQTNKAIIEYCQKIEAEEETMVPSAEKNGKSDIQRRLDSRDKKINAHQHSNSRL
ncbi:MAG: hypothetical protein ACPLYF_05680 [Fervidobacterium sp.]